MAVAGVRFEPLDARQLAARLPALRPRDVSQGIFRHNCGILEPLRLARFYEHGA
jgi:glycine/D-amino acid oxidase-like deaminating enzyme